jgi:hypothetical protein
LYCPFGTARSQGMGYSLLAGKWCITGNALAPEPRFLLPVSRCLLHTPSSGLPPAHGLYCGVIGNLVYALLGTSRESSPAAMALVSHQPPDSIHMNDGAVKLS